MGRQRAVGVRELTVFTLHLFRFQADILRGLPAHLLLDPLSRSHRLQCFAGDVRPWRFVELPSVVVIEVRFDESMFRPTVDRLLVDVEAICHFLLGQHAASAKSIVARAEVVGVDEIGDPHGRKATSARPGRADPPGRSPCALSMSAISA